MSCPFGKDALDRLKQFVDLCTAKPELLHLPELSFFKNYIESLGGKIPEQQAEKMSTDKPAPEKPDEGVGLDEDSEPESDLELDTEGCISPDAVDPNQNMGNPDKEITEEDMDKSDEKRMEAMSQFSEGNYQKAIELYTEAIELNPTSALLFAKRGQAFLKLEKPNACIKDCSKALEYNPDSAAAYKFRGRAYRLIGEWEKAAKDLRLACKIDFDEQTDEWLKEVTPNAKKIEQHKIKQERKKMEKEEKERIKRLQKAREAHAKASANVPPTEQPSATAGAGGAAPGGAGPKPDDFYKLLQDPEIMAAFTDPEVSAAFADISSNPTNFYKYQSNPKVMALVTKLSSKLAASGMAPPFGGMGGAPGAGGFPGFPGGFPGFGGGLGTPPPNAGGAAGGQNFKVPEDDNLD